MADKDSKGIWTHDDCASNQKLIIFRLDEQDKNIEGISNKLDNVNTKREGQHTENQIAFTKITSSITLMSDKVADIESLKKWLTYAIIGAVLSATGTLLAAAITYLKH